MPPVLLFLPTMLEADTGSMAVEVELLANTCITFRTTLIFYDLNKTFYYCALRIFLSYK